MNEESSNESQNVALALSKPPIDKGSKENEALHVAYERGQKKFISLLQENASWYIHLQADNQFADALRGYWPPNPKPEDTEAEILVRIDERKKRAIRDHIYDIALSNKLTSAEKLSAFSAFLNTLDRLSIPAQESGRGREIFEHTCPVLTKALEEWIPRKGLDAASHEALSSLAACFRKLPDEVSRNQALNAVGHIEDLIILSESLTLTRKEDFDPVRERIAKVWTAEALASLTDDEVGKVFALGHRFSEYPDDPLCADALKRINEYVTQSANIAAVKNKEEISAFAEFYVDFLHNVLQQADSQIFGLPLEGMEKYLEFTTKLGEIASGDKDAENAINLIADDVRSHHRGWEYLNLQQFSEFADVFSQFPEREHCVSALRSINTALSELKFDEVSADEAMHLVSLTRSFDRLSEDTDFRSAALNHLLSDVIPAAAAAKIDSKDFLAAVIDAYNEVGRRYLAQPDITSAQKLKIWTDYATLDFSRNRSEPPQVEVGQSNTVSIATSIADRVADFERGLLSREMGSLVAEDCKTAEFADLNREEWANLVTLANHLYSFPEEKNCQEGCAALVAYGLQNASSLTGSGVSQEMLFKAAKLFSFHIPLEQDKVIDALEPLSTMAVALVRIDDDDKNLLDATAEIAGASSKLSIQNVKGDDLQHLFPVSDLLSWFPDDVRCQKANAAIVSHIEAADLSLTSLETLSTFARYCVEHGLLSSPHLTPPQQLEKWPERLAQVERLGDEDGDFHNVCDVIANAFTELNPADLEKMTEAQMSALEQRFERLRDIGFTHPASDSITAFFESANYQQTRARLNEEAMQRLETAHEALPPERNLLSVAGKNYLDRLNAVLPYLNAEDFFHHISIMGEEGFPGDGGLTPEEQEQILEAVSNVVRTAAIRYVNSLHNEMANAPAEPVERIARSTVLAEIFLAHYQAVEQHGLLEQ
ncbi:MAG TPA: hypothetical protein VM532_08420, partial [Burkholderiales bacterium]|nr:hypothetical protein [Burkholderiales bacterium]